MIDSDSEHDYPEIAVRNEQEVAADVHMTSFGSSWDKVLTKEKKN